MKLATIIGPLERFDSVVRDCIVGKEFHPESAVSVMRKIKGLFAFTDENPYVEPLRHAERLFQITDLKPHYAEFNIDDHNLEDDKAYLAEIDRKFTAMRDERDELARMLVEDERIKEQLAYLRDVNVPIDQLFEVTYVKFRYGRIPREIFESFYPIIKDRKDVYYFSTSIQRDYVYGMYMSPRVSSQKVDSLFASLQFERIRLSERLHGSSDEAASEIKRDMENCKRRISEIESELRDLAKNEESRFLKVFCYLKYMSEAFNIRRYAAHTGESFYLMGWVPESEYSNFERSIKRWEDVNYVLVSEDPDSTPEYTPPTKLKNSKIFKPFEPFVSMYGLPAYNEVDPTPLMALTYPLIFGVMFGDIGHGIILLLAGLMMWKLRGMWIGKVLCYCSVSSVIFGFVFGSFFGNEELLPGFKVLHSSETTHTMLQVTMYAGAAVLALAIIINVINGIRQRNYEKILFGSSSIVGLMLYVGIVFTVLPFLGFGSSPLPMPVLLVLIIIPVLLIFLREPLTHLVEKKRVHLEDGAANFILANFFEMFEVLLSYVTNTISFMRIGAYAISHASMMTVVYSLAAAADGSHNIVVLIIGNLIVAVLEALLVAIQVLRLEFYELFGRFYSGSGREFIPLKIDYTTTKDS